MKKQSITLVCVLFALFGFVQSALAGGDDLQDFHHWWGQGSFIIQPNESLTVSYAQSPDWLEEASSYRIAGLMAIRSENFACIAYMDDIADVYGRCIAHGEIRLGGSVAQPFNLRLTPVVSDDYEVEGYEGWLGGERIEIVSAVTPDYLGFWQVRNHNVRIGGNEGWSSTLVSTEENLGFFLPHGAMAILDITIGEFVELPNGEVIEVEADCSGILRDDGVVIGRCSDDAIIYPIALFPRGHGEGFHYSSVQPTERGVISFFRPAPRG